MKKIFVILVLAAVIIFGYYAYQSLKNSAGGTVSKESLKNLIQNKANETQKTMEEKTDESLQDLKDDVSNTIKDKVDQTLGTK
ncbi:MAG: hypothetical protein PHU42_03345 [Patescibacteria group bacterium]|nr:hypothetical protein [Patescibacteria group bacterium]